jgi:hypothetical protein
MTSRTLLPTSPASLGLGAVEETVAGSSLSLVPEHDAAAKAANEARIATIVAITWDGLGFGLVRKAKPPILLFARPTDFAVWAGELTETLPRLFEELIAPCPNCGFIDIYAAAVQDLELDL